MKRFAAFAGVAVLSASAAAQSSLAVYGVVDVGVRYVDNADSHVLSLASNGNNTSRLGFRGLEDLGGGMRAGFQLESGLNPDTGSQSDAARLFNRRSTVSLFSGLGELKIGRDYTITYLGYEDYDLWSDIGLSSVAKFDSSLGTARDTGVRSDNQVVYLTPGGLGGFYASAEAAPGEGVVGKKYVAGRTGYASGPLDVSVSYGQTWVAPVGGSDLFKTFNVGASYDFGPAKVSGYYTQSKFASLEVQNYYIGAQVPMGPGLWRASYLHSNLSGTTATQVSTDPNDASQFAFGYLYKLSKRTAIYSNVVSISNKGASAIAVDKNPTPIGGRGSLGFDLGVRHSF